MANPASAHLDRIVVPVDGSELAARILIQVRRLLVRRDAEVIVVRVVPQERIEAGDSLDRFRRELDDIVSTLRIRGATARGEVLVGDPAERILRFTEEESASLVALATHGRSGVSRWIRGSTAERLLRGSHVPLLLANPLSLKTTGELRIAKILVPLDGSARSTEILPIAGEIARLYGSEVVLQHVLEVVSTEEQPPFAHEKAARAWLREQARALNGLSVRIEVDHGPAAAWILERAEREPADLVALATHGRTGSARWIFGSIAEHVLRHVACPILALRTVHATKESIETAPSSAQLAAWPRD